LASSQLTELSRLLTRPFFLLIYRRIDPGNGSVCVGNYRTKLFILTVFTEHCDG